MADNLHLRCLNHSSRSIAMLVNRGRVRDFIRVLGNLSLADVKTNKIIGHLLKLDRSGTLFTKPLPLSRVRERESVGLDLLAETHTWFLASIARGGIVTAGVRSVEKSETRVSILLSFGLYRQAYLWCEVCRAQTDVA